MPRKSGGGRGSRKGAPIAGPVSTDHDETRPGDSPYISPPPPLPGDNPHIPPPPPHPPRPPRRG